MSDECFLGNFLNGIDAKNRVSIPSGFREVLAARSDARAIVLAPAERADCLVGYDPHYPAKVKSELETRYAGDFTAERDDRFRAIFGASERAAIDDNGRIIVSTAMKDAGEFDGAALFVGMGDFFEVWNPQAFVARPNLDPRIVRMVRRLIDSRGAA